mmetsp:Transcript_6133/g.9365  ORF Transcript_6133/g.9365 Transcript_6133/m.9365 type:complete len:85 (+) Transcript_6133:487-741(+)
MWSWLIELQGLDKNSDNKERKGDQDLIGPSLNLPIKSSNKDKESNTSRGDLPILAPLPPAGALSLIYGQRKSSLQKTSPVAPLV